MTRTMIDLDDDLVERAAALLGTRTKKDTVNQAMRDVVERATRTDQQQAAVRAMSDMPWLTALADPSFVAEARR